MTDRHKNKETVFDDEKIILKSSIKDVADVTKTFTDFTQSFNVPASQNNNKILKHWYNADVLGFDQRERKEANIELNYAPFRFGTIEIKGAIVEDGKIKSYSLLFF